MEIAACKKGWIEKGISAMETMEEVAVMSGILTEQDHKLSIFKQLSALEWQAAFGGNQRYRRQLFDKGGSIQIDRRIQQRDHRSRRY